jgi:thiol-disulfide isomerase/thioredoxin
MSMIVICNRAEEGRGHKYLQMKSKPDSVKFIIHAVVWSLLALALLNSFAPVIAPDEREPEVRAVIKSIIVVPPETLAQRFATSEKPTLLFVYASWCPYCRQVLPYLLHLQDTGALAQVNPLFLSLDGDKRPLAIYIVHAEYAGRYTPYIISQWQGDAVKQSLQQLGSNYRGAIPYIALFDKEKLIGEISGMPGETQLQNLLQRRSHSAN